MFIEERHRAILEIIAEKGRISTSEIKNLFGVGYETAKRDLRLLEQKGLLKRVYGGAIPLVGYGVGKPAGVTCRDYNEVRPDYLAVAKRAALFVENGDIIFISAATVGWFMLGFLPREYSLRIVVNSTILAEELRKNKNFKVVMLGGELDEKGNSYGMYAREILRGMRIDKAFVTSAYISPTFGLSVQSESRAEFLRLVLDCSRKAFGLYPTAKIGAESAISICPASRLHTLITDSDISEEDIAAFCELGVEVVTVSP
ncbi:MAG TPA: DeoR/GlpR transcriptional regulator [Clostridiales bacterium]|nr:DeoR/GlpR transcriptional regulator [Clostridiales bacterium]